MGSLKTFAATCLLSLCAGQVSFGGTELLNRFATCTGRLSAEMEHAWLIRDASADRVETARAAMITLIEAVAGPEEGPGILNQRIHAKHAHAALLRRASFNDDPQDAARAASAAALYRAGCAALLLDPGPEPATPPESAHLIVADPHQAPVQGIAAPQNPPND